MYEDEITQPVQGNERELQLFEIEERDVRSRHGKRLPRHAVRQELRELKKRHDSRMTPRDTNDE